MSVSVPAGSECRQAHSRLLKCTLEPECARIYWTHAPAAGVGPLARQAFDDHWFGARSLGRVEVLVSNLRARFGAFPSVLPALHLWSDMDPDTRRLVCHWHLQLSDPLYRAFTAEYLPERRGLEPPQVRHPGAVEWVKAQVEDRWGMGTRIQFASKLLTTSLSAGLIAGSKDPRPLSLPRVSDQALTYLLYLLRDVEFIGTLTDNPYLASVGLTGALLDARLRGLGAIGFRRQGALMDLTWRYPTLEDWVRSLHQAAPPVLCAAVA